MDTQRQSRPVLGIFWMVVTGLMFVAVTAIVKHVGSDVPAAQAAFLRYILGLVFLLPMISTRLVPMKARVTETFSAPDECPTTNTSSTSVTSARAI